MALWERFAKQGVKYTHLIQFNIIRKLHLNTVYQKYVIYTTQEKQSLSSLGRKLGLKATTGKIKLYNSNANTK